MMKNKSIISVILVFLLFTSMIPAYATGVVISADNCEATPGSTLSVPIHISNNSGIMGFKIVVNYNSDNLTPTSVTYGNLISGSMQDNIDGNMVNGSINVFWAGTENMTDDGILFYVNFNVSNNASGYDRISLDYGQADTFNESFNDVSLICVAGNINYVGAITVPQFQVKSLSNSISVDDPLSVDIVLKNIVDAKRYSVVLDESLGQYTYIGVDDKDRECQVIKSEENSTVTITLSASEIDSIGTVIASIILKPIITMETNYITISPAVSCQMEDNSVLEGEVEACFIGINSLTDVENYVGFQGNHLSVLTGNSIDIPISFLDNKGLMGYRLHFKFDNTKLKIDSLTSTGLFPGFFNHSIGVNDDSFDVMWNGSENVMDNGIAFVLHFTAIGNQTESTIIQLSYVEEDTFDEEYFDVALNCKDIPVSIINSGECLVVADLSELKSIVGSHFNTTENSMCSIMGNKVVNSNYLNIILSLNGEYAEICFEKPCSTKLTISLDRLKEGDCIDITSYLKNIAADNTLLAMGDVNADDVIDIADISELLMVETYGSRNAEKDLNGDQIIDIADISVILSMQNYGCYSISRIIQK